LPEQVWAECDVPSWGFRAFGLRGEKRVWTSLKMILRGIDFCSPRRHKVTKSQSHRVEVRFAAFPYCQKVHPEQGQRSNGRAGPGALPE